METLDPKSPNHILVGVGGTGGKVLKGHSLNAFIRNFPMMKNETNCLSVLYMSILRVR